MLSGLSVIDFFSLNQSDWFLFGSWWKIIKAVQNILFTMKERYRSQDSLPLIRKYFIYKVAPHSELSKNANINFEIRKINVDLCEGLRAIYWKNRVSISTPHSSTLPLPTVEVLIRTVVTHSDNPSPQVAEKSQHCVLILRRHVTVM